MPKMQQGRNGDAGAPGRIGVALREGAIGRIASLAQPMETCIHCGADSLIRWGRTRRGLQRFRCRGCWRTSCRTTGTPLAHLHALDAFGRVVVDMLGSSPRSCRELAAVLGVGRMTIWRWRLLICRSFRGNERKLPAQLVAAASLVVRESRKASREWVDHARDPDRFPAPDRLRWIDYRRQGLPLPDPMGPFLITIEILTTAAGACLARLYGSRIGSDGPVVTETGSLEHLHLPRSTHAGGDRATEMAAFLAPFRGPASKHLRDYVVWFITRQNGGPAGVLRGEDL